MKKGNDMKKASEIFLQILLMIWPEVAALLFFACANAGIQTDVRTWLLLIAVVVVFVLGVIKAFVYRKDLQSSKLAVYGVLQKLAILPVLAVMYYVIQILNRIKPENPIDPDEIGVAGLGVIAVFLVGVAVALITVLMTVIMGVMFVQSVIYMCCAVSVLGKENVLTKPHKILLIIGSCIPITDVICAIMILIKARGYRKE